MTVSQKKTEKTEKEVKRGGEEERWPEAVSERPPTMRRNVVFSRKRHMFERKEKPLNSVLCL